MKFSTIFMGLFLCTPVQAYEWSDLWLNDYQKAQNLLADNPVEAADLFKDPGWQGIANYNAGDFQSAAEKFSESTGESAEYNLGNALAKAGKLEESLASYDKFLENQELPKNQRDDANFNRDLVKKLMQQQEQKQQDQQPSDQDSDQSEESDSDNSESSQNSDQEGQQSPDKKDSEQNEPAEEEQDQQEPSDDDEQQADDEQEGDNDESTGTEQSKADRDQPMTEDQQATEQWLRQIPDDPAGLLRRKLLQSHRTKYPQVQNGGQAW